MTRLKLVHLIIGLDNGGAENMLLKLLSTLDQNKYELIVISMMGEGVLGNLIKQHVSKLYTLNLHEKENRIKKLKKFYNIIKIERPHILQTWMYHADFSGIVIKLLFPNINLVWNIRHSKFIKHVDKKRTIFLAKICGILSCIPNVIICGSESAYESHLKLYYSKKKMIVVPNGFDLQVFYPDLAVKNSIRDQFHIPREATVFGHVGRYHPLKNHENLLRSFSHLQQKHKECYLILCGNNVDLRNEQLNSLLFKLELTNVLMLGDRRDIPSIMKSFDALLLPSFSEGFPNVLGEAMATGLPCIVSDVGDSKSIVGQTGYIIENNDVKGLIDCLERFINLSYSGRQKLSLLARTRITDSFSIQAISRNYDTIYSNLYKG